MNPAELLNRLIAVGFEFRIANGEVEYIRPAADTPEIDESMGFLAWMWGDLEETVRQHLTSHPETCP